MKVLLFVQNLWNKRPPRAVHGKVLVADSKTRPLLTRAQILTRAAADRWWLVECENAKGGREVIASGRTELRSGFNGNGSLLIGRILACGTKEVS